MVVWGATAKHTFGKFAELAIGSTLVLVRIVYILITGTSANPARSIDQALFEGGVALQQLWIFIVVPFWTKPSHQVFGWD